MQTIIALAFLFCAWNVNAAELDLVIADGRVMDPESGLDAIRYVENSQQPDRSHFGRVACCETRSVRARLRLGLGGDSDNTYVVLKAEAANSFLRLTNKDGRQQLIKPQSPMAAIVVADKDVRGP